MSEGKEGSDLGSRARRSAAFSLLGYGGGRLLGLVSNPLLSYLLAPAARGLMEWVNPFVLGFELLSDIGIGPSIIQSRRGGDRAFLDVAWTIQAIRGALLWVLVCASSVPYASVSGHPELVWVVPVAALTALAGGLTSTKMFTASRDLALGRITTIELVSQSAGFVTKLVWAWVDPSVWALVVGGVVNAGSKMVLSHLLLPGAL